jgi:hypothetical protein
MSEQLENGQIPRNILVVATSQIGVQEDKLHTNHGEAMKYQTAAGLPEGGGFAWCMSFVYWCGLQAFGQYNPIPKTGGVLDCWAKVKPEWRIPTIKAGVHNITPGCQFIMDFGKGLGHTGFVESVDINGIIHTIEGNSNPMGGRDGYEVCRHQRRFSDSALKGFILYPYPV